MMEREKRWRKKQKVAKLRQTLKKKNLQEITVL